MALGGLQHFTIEPQDLERSKSFYVDVLGLEVGHRPPLDFPGYWLYSGGAATVHLMGTRKPREGIVVRGTEKKFEDTGRLDHVAFAATDVDGVRVDELPPPGDALDALGLEVSFVDPVQEADIRVAPRLQPFLDTLRRRGIELARVERLAGDDAQLLDHLD